MSALSMSVEEYERDIIKLRKSYIEVVGLLAEKLIENEALKKENEKLKMSERKHDKT